MAVSLPREKAGFGLCLFVIIERRIKESIYELQI